MSRKILISLTVAATFGIVAMTAGSASAGRYGHVGYSSYNSGYSCHKKAVHVPYWRTVWRYKKVSVPYGCGWKTIKVRHNVKRYKTIWKRSCH